MGSASEPLFKSHRAPIYTFHESEQTLEQRAFVPFDEFQKLPNNQWVPVGRRPGRVGDRFLESSASKPFSEGDKKGNKPASWSPKTQEMEMLL